VTVRRAFLPIAFSAVIAGTIALGFAIAKLPGRGVTAPPAGAVAAARVPVPRGFDAFDHHFRRGVELLQAGRAAESVEIFELARRLRPHVPDLDVNLGFAYLEIGDTASARAAFERAIELRPEQANAYFGLAEALERIGDRAGARGAMRTYAHLTPESDPFRRRALAALWEWEAVSQDRAAPDVTASPPER
jgi:tetratricopeptide (TPR) repeat protein